MTRLGLKPLAIAAFMALLAAGARCSRTGQAETAAPLLPLTEADLTSGSRGAGCSCKFNVVQEGEARLLLYGSKFITRTAAGPQACALSSAQMEAVGSGPPISCNGRNITVAVSPQEPGDNTTVADARVTVEENGRSTVLTGAWDCAC